MYVDKLFENLMKSYNALKRKKRNRDLTKEALPIILIFVMFPPALTGIGIQQSNWIVTAIGVISLISMAIFIYKLYLMRKDSKLENHQLIFLEFFEAYKGIHELKKSYENKIEESYNDDRKAAIDAIRSLSFTVHAWIPLDAPSEIIKLQSDWYDNFSNGIINMIRKGEEEEFKSFANYFLDQCSLLQKRDFTYKKWEQFTEKLNEYGIKHRTKEEKLEEKFSNWMITNWRTKSVLGISTWIIAFVILYFGKYLDPLMSLIASSTLAGTVAYILSKEKIVVKIIGTKKQQRNEPKVVDRKR